MEKGEKLHIVMLPWLAFGHMMPFLELSKLLAQKGHQISFVSTPRNIDRLPKLPPNLTTSIKLVKLPLPPHVDNLPENAEATIDVPYNKVKFLKIAYDGLQEPVTNFLETSSPDWLIYDFAPYWIGPIAAKLNISTAFFSIFTAAFLSFTNPTSGKICGKYRTKPEDFTVPPKWIPFKTNVAFRLFEVLRIFDASMEGDDENVSDLYRIEESIRGCDVFLLRSCYELEREWLNLLEELHQRPVLPVGQLPPLMPDDNKNDEEDDAWRIMKAWLDKQEKGLVVYVAFGTEAKPSQDELTEIALGLENSGLPFFWVLRKQRGSADTELVELPQGFEERITRNGQGFMCTSWAPQLKILSHDSVGGFLTHSGWSSVVEGIMNEKALILLPFLADQGLNARFLEEKNMAYSVPRNERNGSFTRDSVAESLRLVMLEEKMYKEKVKQMKGIFGDRTLQDYYVDNLVRYLQSHTRK